MRGLSVELHQKFAMMYTEKVQKQQAEVEMLHRRQTDQIQRLRYKPYSKYPNAYEVYSPEDYMQKIHQAEYWLNKYKEDYAEYLL